MIGEYVAPITHSARFFGGGRRIKVRGKNACATDRHEAMPCARHLQDRPLACLTEASGDTRVAARILLHHLRSIGR